MLSNTDITIYNRMYDSSSGVDQWRRVYIPSAWWHKSEKSSITTEGLNMADVYTVRIPDKSGVIELKKDDYVVKGNCVIKMKTVKDLNGMEKFRVSSANHNLFGGNPHIKAVGK